MRPKTDWHKWLCSGAFAAAFGMLSPAALADGLARYQVLHDAAMSLYPGLQEQAQDADHAGLIATVWSELGRDPIPQLPAPTPAEPLGAGRLQLIDMRIALVQLAVHESANDQLSLIQAQPSDAPQVIAVQAGAVSLAEIHAWLAEQPDTARFIAGDTLRAPLIVLQGAALTLQPGDTLLLSRSDGAFLANFGELLVDEAKIAGTAEPNAAVPTYAPFVTTVGTGRVTVTESVFADLGFGETALFSGFTVSNGGLYPPIGPSTLQDSMFINVGEVTLMGTKMATLRNNVFSSTTEGGLALRGAQHTQVRGNLFLQAGLRLTDQSYDNDVSDNILMGSTGAGISVARASANNVVSENFIWDSAKTGISVTDSDCILLTRNISIRNQQKGMVLRASRQNQVLENEFLGNQSTGLFISNQVDGTDTTVSGNVFAGNRTGLGSSAANRLLLSGNDFREQFPRFVDGDITTLAHQIIADLEGTQDIEISAGGVGSYRAFDRTPAEACLWQKDS